MLVIYHFGLAYFDKQVIFWNSNLATLQKTTNPKSYHVSFAVDSRGEIVPAVIPNTSE